VAVGKAESLFELAHPIYLDTPMLVSFLAALDDGVSYTSEVAERQAEGRKSGGEGSANVKLPSLASLLGLSLSASGKYARDKTSDQSTESKFVREHTSASLFNRLRSRLHSDGLVVTVNDGSSLASMKAGSLIETAGRFSPDPMRTIVDFTKNIWPYIEGNRQNSAARSRNRSQRRNLPPHEREVIAAAERTAAEEEEAQAQTMRMVQIVENELGASPVVDLVLHQKSFSGIVTANREYFGSEVAASLVGGQFSLIGKVTAVDSSEDARTPIIRRGALGTVLSTAVVPLLQSMRDAWAEGGADVEIPDAYINGPYIQVIPLAIFV
jgi:hypothetical protein